MLKGYMGKGLVVDLSKGETKTVEIPDKIMKDYVGGEGFGVRILFDNLKPKTDPFSPENLLIFTTGPLTGTSAPTSGRLCVVFKSPLTNTIGASNVGGYFAPTLKKCGYDVLVIKGRAEEPVYLWIHDDNVEIRKASHLWGKGVEETEETILKEVGNEKAVVASIGIAGEKLSRIAAIMFNSHRAAGRGGPGAVMGSKNLKAIAVYGTKEIAVADKSALNSAAKKARAELEEEDFVREELKVYGTPSFTDAINGLGILPTKNWQHTMFDAMDKIGNKAYHEKLNVKAWHCYGCPIGCGRYTEIPEGPYRGMKGGGPEYESIAAFGSKCMVDDLYAITAANHKANDYGLDIISTGQVIATAMEWYEEGIITKDDTDGIELSFGNADAVVKMVDKIARREGLGDLLAEGSLRAAQKIGKGAEQYVMHVKGMEMAADGVRASKGEAISHMTSERGADHLRPYASAVDAFGYREKELGITYDISPVEDGNKAWVKPLKELSMATNLLGVCLFASITLAVKGSTWAELLSGATGNTYSLQDLLLASERVINLERLYNAREGFDKKDDRLPERFLKEKAKEGPGKGQIVDVETLLKEYYNSMGWDLNTGLPTQEKIKQLGIEDIEFKI